MNKLIKLSETHYVICDDSEIKEGDCRFHLFEKTINLPHHRLEHGEKWATNSWKKITHSTKPLERYEGTETLVFRKIKPLKLSEVEEVVYGYSAEKMADVLISCSDNVDVKLVKEVWKAGFKAHQKLVKDKLFTIDDVAEICFKLFNHTPSNSLKKWERRHYNNFVQSLLPKNEWNVEIEPYFTDECERLEGTRDGENIKVTYKIKLI